MTARALLSRAIVFLAFCLPGLPGTATADSLCNPSQLHQIPVRSAAALPARGFVQRVKGMNEAGREKVIRSELLAGNLPRFLRRLTPVTLNGKGADGRPVEVTLCVLPDYLAIGSNEDFLRIPMGLETALVVADRFGFVLPTAKMVDAIYRQAAVKLPPRPLPPGSRMRTTAYYLDHERRVEAQLQERTAAPGALIAGHKKDLVLTERLRRIPGRVAIYGWHRTNGKPIQPLSTVHGARYADYSHGVRLVSDVAYVDGEPRPLVHLLEDPQFAPVLNDEGAIPDLDRLIAALGPAKSEQLAGLPVSTSHLR